MLVQKNRNKRSLYGITRNTSIKNQLLRKELERAKEQHDENYVDEKYRDFHRNRQSEKVLNVIRSVLEESDGSFHKKEDLFKKSQAGSLQEKIDQQTEEERNISIEGLIEENFSLKSQLCLIYDYMNSGSKSSVSLMEESVDEQEANGGDDEDDAIDIMTCEKGSRTACNEESHHQPADGDDKLRQMIVQLKIECLQEKTEKEMLRLKVLELQQSFQQIEDNYQQLSDQCEFMEVSYSKRLDKANDQLHHLKYPKKKSLFQRLVT